MDPVKTPNGRLGTLRLGPRAVTAEVNGSPSPTIAPPDDHRDSSRSRVLAWRYPRLYETYFALSPLASALRARELRAVLAAVDATSRPSDSVLEVGAGPGTYTRHLATRCRRVVAMDSSANMLARLASNMSREGIDNVEARWGRLPDAVDSGRFDGVVAAGVLDYLLDLVEALAVLRSSLRPGGWSVFTVPLARPTPRLAALLEDSLIRRAYPRRPGDLSAAAVAADLDVRSLQEVRLGGVGRTLVVHAAAVPDLRPVATRPAAPDVALALEGGGRRPLASFRGRPVVIAFVQPYCATCIPTLRTLDAVARAHPDGSVIPIALNVGVGGPGDLRSFAASVGVTHPLFANDPGLRVANAFGVQELETFVVIDAQGRVVTRGVGLPQSTVLSAVGQA